MKTKLSFFLCIVLMSWPISGFTQPVSLDSKLKPCQGSDTNKWTNCVGTFELFGLKFSIAEFKNGKRNGQGVVKLSNGDVFNGQYKDDKINGFGTIIYSNGDKYVGQWKDDNFHGQGTFTYVDGLKYVGQYVNGKKEGQGTIFYTSGDKFIGELKNDLPNGQGTYFFLVENEFKGDTYVGEFKDELRDGRGTYNFKDGKKIIGIWEKDKLIKDEGIITLSCLSDKGRLQGIEIQLKISEQNNSVTSSRGQSPTNILITSTLIQFKQDTISTSINRISGMFSLFSITTGNVLGSGICVAIDQVKPKF